MTSGRRHRVMVALDFQNLGVSAENVEAMDSWIRGEVDRRFPVTSHEVYRAYCRPNQEAAIAELRRLRWRVKATTSDSDQWIIQETKSYCGESPGNTVVFLCSKDRDFSGLVQELRNRGVDVYGMGPSGASQRLVQAVGRQRWIQYPNRF